MDKAFLVHPARRRGQDALAEPKGDCSNPGRGEARAIEICSAPVALVAGMILFACVNVAAAFDIVRAGKPVATLVIPDHALPVVSAAAQELQYHVKQSTGTTLPLVQESGLLNAGAPPTPAGRIYLGRCEETERSGIHPEKLPPNAFIIKLIGDRFFLAGNDSEGEPFWILHNNWTRVGTLFAVYEFLEKQLGCRWLWPGKLGEVIPQHSSIQVVRWDQTCLPPFLHSRWRDGGTSWAGTTGWSAPEARSRYLQDQGVWLRRQRFAMGINMDIRHSFSAFEYWNRFGKSHPEYFNLLPEGTRRADPFYWGGDASLISMSVAEPALWKQIVEDWKTKRTPAIPFIDASEDDTNGKCVCDKCLAWDVPAPNALVPFGERVAAAKKAFDAGDATWDRFLGSLSDRYARFYLAVQKEAQKVDTDVRVMGLAYANYVKPPLKTKLNDHITLAIVPELMFPWTDEKRKAFRKQWDGWSAAGATLMLRPNYMLDGHNFPINFARKLGQDFAYAARRGLIATDFDSLTGQWSTQGPNLYMLGRLHAHPDWTADRVLEEYYQGFGKAGKAVRAYFAHWEQVTDAVTDKTIADAVKQKNAETGDFARFHRIASVLFTPEIMAKGRSLLSEASKAARGDSIIERRVDFLAKGFKNAELTLAAQEGFERYKQTGDIAGYRAAVEALDAFRKSVEDEEIANMCALAWMEAQTWNRPLLALLKQPGEPLPATWKFKWDPGKRGQSAGWQSDDFDDSPWSDIGIDSAYEKQEVGKQWIKAHGSDYHGLCWYRARFNVQPGTGPQQARLVFGAVDEACTIWVNGQLVLERPYPYQGNTNSWQEAFEVDVTKVLRTDRPNALAVRVENSVGDGGVWKPVWLLQSAAPAPDDRNLVKDGGFELSPTPWSNQTQCGEIAYLLDAGQSHNGKASARITCSKLAPPEAQTTFKARAWGRWYQPEIAVKRGKTYRLRLWVRTTNDFTGKAAIWIRAGGEEGTKNAEILNTQGFWREVVIDGIVPGEDKGTLYLNLMDGTGSVWFDDVELVEQEKPLG